MWDLIVIGGGTSGVAAAVMASKNNVKTLLIEKNSFLGGSQTGSLVTPMMKSLDNPDDNINNTLLNEVLTKLESTGDCATNQNGNKGWFNPEIMKIILDEICIENDVELLFETSLISAKKNKNKVNTITVHNKEGIQELKAKYFIDATGDADLAKLSGIKCNEISQKEHQAVSLRFNMSGVDIKKLSNWLLSIDKNRDVTSSYQSNNNQTLLTTAYTWDTDNKNDWALRPYFEKAILNGDIKKEDSAYFQIFSIPGQSSTITFNCPRIYSEKYINVLNAKDRTKSYIQGRKQILRLANFCKKYLIGFKNSFISQIATDLGVRTSRRIKGDYLFTKENITKAQKFKNPVFRSNYPIDVHSDKKDNSLLKEINTNDYYEIPKEALFSKEISNLIIVGKAISADFIAQSSLRIQPNCWSMGEFAGKTISERLQNNE